MKIDCYISEGCTSEEALRVNVVNALRQENMKAEVQYHRINESEAKKMGIMGSPTVFINDVDILPGEMPGIS
jgi:protein-disulfide isomerase